MLLDLPHSSGKIKNFVVFHYYFFLLTGVLNFKKNQKYLSIGIYRSVPNINKLSWVVQKKCKNLHIVGTLIFHKNHQFSHEQRKYNNTLNVNNSIFRCR